MMFVALTISREFLLNVRRALFVNIVFCLYVVNLLVFIVFKFFMIVLMSVCFILFVFVIESVSERDLYIE